MRLSRWGYQADFYVYPALIVACTGVTLWHAPLRAVETSIAAVGAGLLAWTALEYALHRWLLHCVPPFKRLHALHHAHPSALIGTPTWLSAPLFLALWAALTLDATRVVAGGLSTGLMIGYLAYAAVHDAVHHRRARPGSWLHHAKERHARHHRGEASTEFGVSSGLWDAILHTTTPAARRSA